MKILEVKDVTAGYDREIDVLRRVTLSVGEKESVSLIGANGAGKSTLLKVISGLLYPKQGEILYRGERIHRLEPHRVVARGIIQIPEEKETFATLTVAENLQVVCQTKRSKAKKIQNLQFVLETFPVLADRKNQEGPNPQRRGAEDARRGDGHDGGTPIAAVGMTYQVGLAPKVVGLLYDRLKELRDLLRIPILMVEQNVEIALNLTERGYVLSG